MSNCAAVPFRTSITRLAFLLLGAASLSGCGASQNGASLVLPGDVPGFGIALDDVGANDSFVVGSIPLCIKDANGLGKARITSVRPAEATGGLAIRQYAVREGEAPYTGAEPGVIPEQWSRDQVVSRPCPAEPNRVAELVVEAHKPQDEPATTDGLLVTYELSGQTRTLQIPLRLKLCPNKTDAKGCLTDQR